MTKTKWSIFYGAVIFVDLLQLLLNLFGGVGIVLNRFIDFFVAFFLPFSLHLCGVNMTDTKRILSVLGAFGLEMIPIFDSLPLWTLDLIVIHATYLSEEKLKEKAPKIIAGMNRINNAAKALNKDGVRLPTGRDTI